MTGLRITNDLTECLQDRYASMRKACFQYSIMQVGICLFKKLRVGEYESVPYNFHVFPDDGRKLEISVPTLKFHQKVGTDFNTWIYKGIPYTNRKFEKYAWQKFCQTEQEDQIVNQINEADQERIDSLLNQLGEWIANPTTDTFVFPHLNNYLKRCIYATVPQQYPQVTLTSESPEGTNQQSLIANLFTEEQQKAYVDGQMDKFHAKIGFRRIFKELVRSKKPVIGHNCMYDFMFVFQAFHEELPQSYEHYKVQLNQLFPVIFDTKAIQNHVESVREALQFGTYDNHLEGLFKYCNDNVTGLRIEFREGFGKYESGGYAHEAAYDAYMTGVCFLKLHQFGPVASYANIMNVVRNLWFSCLAQADYLVPGELLFVKHALPKVSTVIQSSPDHLLHSLNSTTFILQVINESSSETVKQMLAEHQCNVNPYVPSQTSKVKSEGKKGGSSPQKTT